MPTPRHLLALLTRDELVAVVDRFQLSPPDRRAKDGLIDTVAKAKQVSLKEILADYSRDRLKELCRGLGHADNGKEKAALVERVIGHASGVAERPAAPYGTKVGADGDCVFF